MVVATFTCFSCWGGRTHTPNPPLHGGKSWRWENRGPGPCSQQLQSCQTHGAGNHHHEPRSCPSRFGVFFLSATDTVVSLGQTLQGDTYASCDGNYKWFFKTLLILFFFFKLGGTTCTSCLTTGWWHMVCPRQEIIWGKCKPSLLHRIQQHNE